MPLDADAHRARRAFVVADDLRVDAEAGVGEHHMRDERRQQQDDDRRRHAERPSLPEPDDLRGQAVDRNAVAQHQREAARDAEHAERDDEWRDRALGDEEAVDARRSNAPVARQPRIPIHQGRSRLEVSIAPTTPESARIEPTERSMPADEMTNVMPIASTPNTDVDSRMLRTLETERKAFDRTAISDAEHGEDDQQFEPRRAAAAGEALRATTAGAAVAESRSSAKPSPRSGDRAAGQCVRRPAARRWPTSRIAASGPCSPR